MAESRGQGPRRGDKPRGAGQSGRSGAGSGATGRGGAARGGPAASDRSGAPRRGDAPRGQGGRPPRDDRRGDRRDERDDRRIRPRDDAERSADQAKYDGPPLDPEISGKELDRNVAQQLRGLPEKLAARVARHLVAAGMLLDEDPKTAYQHTLAARARAARIAVVREACGEAAY